MNADDILRESEGQIRRARGPNLMGRTFRNGVEVLYTFDHPCEWWNDRQLAGIYVDFCRELWKDEV